MPTAPDLDALLRRIRALCAKAEASPFPEEAEAFLGKAQELMTRHAIDDAMVRRATGPDAAGIVRRDVMVPGPYASARVSLLAAAARPNHCRVVLAPRGAGGRRCVVVGHTADVDLALALHGYLDQQAIRALRVASAGASRPRAFRHAFLLSFSARIGQRLADAARRSQADEVGRRGRSVALALRDRHDAVDRAFFEWFPFSAPRRATASSATGAALGLAAADRAILDRPGLSTPKSLGRGSRS